jgi:hypothetical protein
LRVLLGDEDAPRRTDGLDVAFEVDDPYCSAAVDEWAPLEGRSANAGMRIRL